MNAGQLVAYLNSIRFGEIESVRAKLDRAREACCELNLAELVDSIDDASRALKQDDLKTFRKRVESVVARLGHLK